MLDIQATVAINRPIEEVFEYVTNPENNTEWLSGVLNARSESRGPVAVGARSTQERQFLGQRIKTTFEVVEFVHNKKLVYKTHSGPLKFEGEITFESIEGGTEVGIVAEAETRGFFKKAEKIASGSAQRQMETDFATLKAILENQD